MNNSLSNCALSTCKDCRDQLADLLLDPASASAAATAHIASCDDCRQELAGLRSTFAALDAWTAPEPSAFFDTRMHARLREAQAQPAEGVFARLRDFFMFSTGRTLRPALAGALALAIFASGGTFVGIHGLHFGQPTTSATVNDLKILDNNEQALQQMDQLIDDNSDDDPPTS